MGHNSGQNIDDILKKLKASVESSDKAAVELEEKDKNAEPSEMSADVLQNELRNQFMTGDEVSDTENVLEGEDSYNIDDDFLSEAVAEEESVAEKAEIETVIEAEAEKESDTEVEAEVEEESESEIEEEIEAELDVDADIDAEAEEDELPWEEEPVVAEEEFVEAEEFVGDELAEEEALTGEVLEDETFEEEIAEEEITEEETFEEEAEEVVEDEEVYEESEEEYEYYESLDDEVIELLTENISGEEFNEWLNEDDEDDEYEEDEGDEDDEDDEDYKDGSYPLPEEIELVEAEIEEGFEENFDFESDLYSDNAEAEEASDASYSEEDAPDKTFIAMLRDNNIEMKPDSDYVYTEPNHEEISASDDAEEPQAEDIPLADIDEIAIEEPDTAELSDDDLLGDYFDSLTSESDSDAERSDDTSDVKGEEVSSAEKRDNSAELLSQFGYSVYDEELHKTRGFDDNRIKKIKSNYFHKKINVLAAFAGSALISVLSFFYELLPLLGVEFGGIMNYRDYPVSYALIGLQLLVFCIAISWRKLWEGIKSLVSLAPDRNSIATIAVIFTVIYDIIIAISQCREMPVMFNFLAVFTLTVSLFVDLMMIHRESRGFEVYFSEHIKYTSLTDTRKTSVAEKMYRGGLSSTQNVFIPAQFSASSTYFRAIDDRKETHKLIYWLSLPSVALTLFIWVFGVVLGRGALEVVGASMTVLFAVLPLSIVFADALPLFVSGARLYKRDIALAGVKAIRRFSECNVMVFKDIHFFEKCTPENTGMVFYDESNAQTVFKCLNAIYSRLGGPMTDVFSRISKEGEDPLDVRFVRISAKGTEAVVDGNKTVLLGTYEFMSRYGLAFPKSDGEDVNDDSLTLCISINGRVSAKISVKYKSAGLFEMIAERLAAEGTFCVIETYDPLISSELIINARLFGKAPISVVHLNLGDMARESYDEKTENKALLSGEPIGVAVSRSRLKLGEALVWCKRLMKIRNKCSKLVFAGSMVGVVASLLIFFLDLNSYVNQFSILAFQALICFIAVIFTLTEIPSRKYFNFQEFCLEMEKLEAEENAASEEEEGADEGADDSDDEVYSEEE